MPARAPAERSLVADGCVLAILVPVEVGFGLVCVAVLLLKGHPGGAAAWSAGMASAALGAAVFFFRDGYRLTGVAQALAAVFFLILMVSLWTR